MVPFGIDAPAGVTPIETRVADVTVSFVDALMLPDAALIVVLPEAIVVANPAELIVATAAVEDVQMTELVTSCMLPSLKVPAALNCCICPVATVGFGGMTVSETRVAGLTVVSAEPVMLPDVAIIFAVPALSACARPEALTEMVVGALELHVTDEVMSREVPLLNSPSALNCCEVPLARDAPVGVTVRDVKTSVGGGRLAEPDDEPPHAFAAKHTATRQAMASTHRTRFGMQIKLLLLRKSSPGVEMKTSHVFLCSIVTDFAV